MDDRYDADDRERFDGREPTVETPTEAAHKRGLLTGLVLGVIGGAIVGGIIVGLVESATEQTPVASSPETLPDRRDTVWGTAESDLGEGREDRDTYQDWRSEESQERLEGPGATPGTQPAPRPE